MTRRRNASETRALRAARLIGPLVALLLAGILLDVGFFAGGGIPYRVYGVFAQAVDLVPGLAVNENGVAVGQITNVSYRDGQAVVGIGITKAGAYPLHRGTTAEIRFGTTIGNGTRTIDLQPGPATGAPLPNGALLPESSTVTPVEFDQVFNTFGSATRSSLRQLSRESGSVLGSRGEQLARIMRSAPPALASTARLFEGLDGDEVALKNLVSYGAAVAGTLAARTGAVDQVLGAGAATFATFAGHTSGISGSLVRFPSALNEAEGTLARLDSSLVGLRGLIDDLRPAVPALEQLASVAPPALAQLRQIVPSAVQALRTGTRVGPQLTKLLHAGTPTFTLLAPTLAQLAPMVACVRPYSPELAGALSNWASFADGYDQYGNYARMQILAGPTSLTSTPPVNEAAFLKVAGDTYALPRPPGLNNGHPWFLPQCGTGPNSLDPNADPEHH